MTKIWVQRVSKIPIISGSLEIKDLEQGEEEEKLFLPHHCFA